MQVLLAHEFGIRTGSGPPMMTRPVVYTANATAASSSPSLFGEAGLSTLGKHKSRDAPPSAWASRVDDMSTLPPASAGQVERSFAGRLRSKLHDRGRRRAGEIDVGAGSSETQGADALLKGDVASRRRANHHAGDPSPPSSRAATPGQTVATCNFEAMAGLVAFCHVVMPLMCAPLVLILIPDTPFNAY